MFRPYLLRRLIRWTETLWPWLPLAAAMLLIGALNIMKGLRYQPELLSKITQLSLVTQPLSFLGHGAQIVLGTGLVVVGLGLLWRLAAAWAFAVLFLAIAIGVNLAQGKWDTSLYLPAFILLALLAFRKDFTRQTFFANFVFSLISILAIFAYGVLGTLILGQQFKPPVHDPVSAFYFTVITLATVGYGDITPITPEARLFVVSLILVGLSVFATVIVSALGPTISTELDLIFRPKRKKMKPKNHVILTGEGAIARNTARELIGRGIPFVHIVSSQAEPDLPEHSLVRGNPGEDPSLREAGIEQARLVIAAQDDDGENAFISLIAKDLNPQVRVLAVASSAKSIRRLKLAGAEIVFAPSVVGSRLLVDLVEDQKIPADFMDLLEGGPRSS